MDALPNGLHRLAGAGDAEVPLGALDKQALGNRPGLNAASAAVEDLVAVWLTEKGQLAGKPNVDICHQFSGGSKYLIFTVLLTSVPSSP